MTDSIQEFSNYFAFTVEGIVQELHYFPSLYLILGISFAFKIISLKKWFNTMERDSISLTKFQLLNLSKSVEKL